MTDAEPFFVDTNILIYANVATAPLHEQALKALRDAHQAGRPLWISRQCCGSSSPRAPERRPLPSPKKLS
jgi:hypothetical protein